LLTGITDGFIAVARQHAEYQVQQEKFPAEKVFLIPNGIDTDHFQFDPAQRDRWRKKLAIPNDVPVVGIVAALRKEKNHELFLTVARNVSRQLPQSQFVIAGDGPQRTHLENLANTLRIADRVHFLGSVEDVGGVLSMTDLFALTSHNEASPVSIMEALSCQRPVVAPAVGSIDETVHHGRNGFLVPPGRVEQTTECWLRILNDPQLAQKMGSTGREIVVDNCSLDQMTTGYTNLVEQVFATKMKSKSHIYENNPIGLKSPPTIGCESISSH
jgi:glycosyltransferase involved in cell wall biosynthesis